MFHYSTDLDGNHHPGFVHDFMEALGHSHKVRPKKPLDTTLNTFTCFYHYIASFDTKLLIASEQSYFISRLFYPLVGNRYSLIQNCICIIENNIIY